MTREPKLLVVGWDGATFDLLDPWIASGDLPNLARLISGGVRGPLRSVPNMNSGPAWTSVSTGLNPGKHGIYGLVGFIEGSYRLRPLNATDRRARPIWHRLSEAGRRVVVMNLPMTYPAEPVNGVLIAGGDAPSAHSPGVTYPAELGDELRTRVGDYIVAERVDELVRQGEKSRALGRILEMVESRTQAARYLMQRQPWDLCLLLFTASDTAQHYFWEDLAGGPHRDAIRTVFRHLDAALGELITEAGEETTTVVLSDHGFGELVVTTEFLNDFLSQLGLLRYRTQNRSRAQILRRLFAGLERPLSDRMRAWLLERVPRLRGLRSVVLGGIDWTGTQAFNLAGSSQIWVNVRGRHPQGTVSPGQEYEAVVSLVQRTLSAAVDPATGKPAVKAVHRHTDLYHGPFLEQAPDLLVEWAKEPARSGLAWQGTGRRVSATRRVAYRPFLINGDHRRMGILAAAGPPIRQGTMVEGACLYDIAPTLLHLLGQPIPSHLDGEVLTQALDDQWLQAHPLFIAEEEQDSSAGPPLSMGAEDEAAVMARLRALGYVE
jgi:predicted AlkP superfamily phosphohydrolase/phosphomutase